MNTETFIGVIIIFIFLLWTFFSIETLKEFEKFNKFMQTSAVLWCIFMVLFLIYIL